MTLLESAPRPPTDQARCVGGNRFEVELTSGLLRLRVDQANWPLSDLCQYASRQNRLRGFLFISKVLGKHWPVRPRTMRKAYEHLAKKIPASNRNTVFIGLAETATGLAAGVFDEFVSRHGDTENVFLQTTRYALDAELAFEAHEAHSHAPCHWVYQPVDPKHRQTFSSAERLVIIDDELSTGATIANIVLRYREFNPHLSEVLVLSLTDWLSRSRRRTIAAEVGVPVRFGSLLRGELEFLPSQVEDKAAAAFVARPNSLFASGTFIQAGRTGVATSFTLPEHVREIVETISTEQRVLVLGTGEFLHLPFLLAEALESRGVPTWFQSTTRSPIEPGPAIRSVLRFSDACIPDLPNFLYNVKPGDYDRVLIGYETREVCREHDVVCQLSATPISFLIP